MINEEVTKEVGEIIKQTVIYTYRVSKGINSIEKDVKEKLRNDFDKIRKQLPLEQNNQIKLKELYKKGQLEQIDVNKSDLKNFKKELNRYGVDFSVMKDRKTKDYLLFFQAKDSKIIEKALKNTIFTTKEKEKTSTIKDIKKYKDVVKQREQSKNKEKTKTKIKAPVRPTRRKL